jgi:hypothetical protein
MMLLIRGRQHCDERIQLDVEKRLDRHGLPCSARAMELFPTLPMPFRTMMRGPSFIVACPEL